MSVLDLLSRVLGLEAGRLVEESAAAREIMCCVNLECSLLLVTLTVTL